MTQRRGINLLRQGWPFALLCLAASSEGWITDNWPQAGSTLASETVACALAAVLSFGLPLLTPQTHRTQKLVFSTALGGALLLAGPFIGLFVMSSLEPAHRVLALTLTPVVVAVAEAALGAGNPGLSARGLWPGLAAVTGLLLILPEPSLANARNDVALLLAPVLTGIGCVLFRRHAFDAKGATTNATAAFTGACLLFGLGTALQASLQHTLPSLSLPAAGIDLVFAPLAILSLQRLTATQYAARYALVPLLVLLQSLLLFPSAITARALTSILLLAGAALSLLWPQDENPEEASLLIPPSRS